MRVQVRMFAALARHLPPGSTGKRATIELEEGATVDDLARKLRLDDQAASILVNDEARHRLTALKEGDVVSFFPPLAGGWVT